MSGQINPGTATEEIPDYDTTKYSSQENFKWATEKRLETVVVEKTIANDIDEAFHIHAAYTTLGWRRLLYLEGEYYPDLVKQFYANIEEKQRKFKYPIISWVKGVMVVITGEMISDMLGLPMVGEPLDFNRDMVTSDPSWKIQEAEQHFNVK